MEYRWWFPIGLRFWSFCVRWRLIVKQTHFSQIIFSMHMTNCTKYILICFMHVGSTWVFSQLVVNNRPINCGLSKIGLAEWYAILSLMFVKSVYVSCSAKLQIAHRCPLQNNNKVPIYKFNIISTIFFALVLRFSYYPDVSRFVPFSFFIHSHTHESSCNQEWTADNGVHYRSRKIEMHYCNPSHIKCEW